MGDAERRVERQIQRVAAWVPGYIGYDQRERRRDADREMRQELARQYSAQLDRLTDAQRRATNKALLDPLDDMERVALKLQRFIDRLRTASYGYAGWFETAPVREPELEQLYAFDQTLAAGVERVAAGIDAVGEAIGKSEGVEAEVEALAGVVDELNRRFDQRRDLIAEGKKVPPNELKDALAVAEPASPILEALADLKVDDALTYDGVDYLIAAKVTYEVQGRLAYAYKIEDTGTERWLRVASDGSVALFETVGADVSAPPAATLELDGESFSRTDAGQAKASILGPGGRREGLAEYWLYTAGAGTRLWVEQWGDEVQVHRGAPVDVDLLNLWPRK